MSSPPPSVRPLVSVVIPARNAALTLPECLRAIAAQSLPRSSYEVIVVVHSRSNDDTLVLAREHGVIVLEQQNNGAAAARNQGIEAARGRWICFTDADCIPSRGWLRSLTTAVGGPGPGDAGSAHPEALGAAGPTIGFRSESAAARFVDLSGGLQAERHLAHERYPWAPTTNVIYRRDALLAVGGFDPRFESYEGCDLHTRLLRQVGGEFVYAPVALVHHRHRASWRGYWRQQVSYGRGYAQFFRRYSAELTWSARRETGAWLSLAASALRAAVPGRSDAALVRRGTFVKSLAQRIGFITAYASRREAARWRPSSGLSAESVP